MLHRVLTLIILCVACDSGDVCDASLDDAPAITQSRLHFAEPLDAPQPTATTAVFREEGKPWLIVLPTQVQLGKAMGLGGACPLGPVTLSWSGRLPDITKTDQHVLGFCYSVMATQASMECMQDTAYKAGGIDY